MKATPLEAEDFPEDSRSGDRYDLGFGIFAQVVYVTPKLAARWLKLNHPDNRGLNRPRIAALVSDLMSDSWKLTHQAVGFDSDGNLINGQHRLTAVVESDVACQMLVIQNKGGSLSDPIDQQWTRKKHSVLKKSTRCTAGLTVLRSLETGYQLNHGATLAELETMLDHHGDVLESLQIKIPSFDALPGGYQGGLVWAYPFASEAVIKFGTALSIGENAW